MTAVRFGEAVRKARIARNMTLRALAKAVDCSAPFVSDVEHGRRLPTDVAIWEAVLGIPGELSSIDPRHVDPATVAELESRLAKVEAEVRRMRKR